MFLGYEVESIELIARQLANGDNVEFKRLLEEEKVSEVVRMFAIDAAINYSQKKNAEQ